MPGDAGATAPEPPSASDPQPSSGPGRDPDRASDRASERETLLQKVRWLRAQADAIATSAPLVHSTASAAAKVSTAATADTLRELDAAAHRAISTSREDIEDLAATLERTAHLRRERDDFADESLLPRSRSSEATGAVPSFDVVTRLVDDVADDLPGDAGARCRARLRRADAAERTILADLIDSGLTHDQLVRLLEGGHLLLPGHRLLERWRALPGVTPRTSSHYHPDDRRVGRGPDWVEAVRAHFDDAHAKPVYGQQYGLRGRFVHEALFGPGPHHTTFIQLERAAPSKLHLLRHIADWVRYRLTRRNQGPYGSSIDTDRNPMRAIVRWKPTKRSAPAVRLDEARDEIDELVARLVDVSTQLDAQARLRSVVLRGVSPDDFDVAVGHAIDDVRRAAAAVSALGSQIRGESRVQ